MQVPSTSTDCQRFLQWCQTQLHNGCNMSRLVALLDQYIRHLDAVIVLTTEYIPACLFLGTTIWDCTWSLREFHSGSVGTLALHAALQLLSRLDEGAPQKGQYTKTAIWALLLWNEWFSMLPGCTMNEECCEGLLSKLTACSRTHPRHISTEQVMDLWLLLRLAGPHASTVRSHEPTRRLLTRVQHRLAALSADCPPDISWIDWTVTQGLRRASAGLWPTDCWFPGTLWVRPLEETVRKWCMYCVYVLLRAGPSNTKMVPVIRDTFMQRSSVERRTREEQIASAFVATKRCWVDLKDDKMNGNVNWQLRCLFFFFG